MANWITESFLLRLNNICDFSYIIKFIKSMNAIKFIVI
jgi:hypothetical protein